VTLASPPFVSSLTSCFSWSLNDRDLQANKNAMSALTVESVFRTSGAPAILLIVNVLSFKMAATQLSPNQVDTAFNV
jgi:hypothetical protein